MAIKASNQVDLLDMTDGYTVVLTNDNYTFLGTTTAVNGTQTTSTQVMALQGSETVPAKIGTITCPTGISAVSDGKTPMPTITITATSALTKTGSFTIPVTVNEGTVNEVTINKVFSFLLLLKEIKEFKVQVLKSHLNQFNMSVLQVVQQHQLVDGKILFHQLAQETTYGQ